jgi:hypothetical protein
MVLFAPARRRFSKACSVSVGSGGGAGGFGGVGIFGGPLNTLGICAP